VSNPPNENENEGEGEGEIDFLDFLDGNAQFSRSHYVRAGGAEVKFTGAVLRAREELGERKFIDRFGMIPTSVLYMDKHPDHMALINGDAAERKNLRAPEFSGYAAKLKSSTYNPTQARLLLDYYMPPMAHVLDPFMGRGTRPVMTYDVGMSYTGFDTCPRTIALNQDLLERANGGVFPEGFVLHHGDGTALAPYADQENVFDGVFTCPPYYNTEVYSGEAGDLSHLSDADFDDRIRAMFRHLYRLVKPSGKYRPDIHSVVITVGTARRGEGGLIDMDFVFQSFAKEAGFILQDKVIHELRPPGKGFTFRRNWASGYVTKGHETTLVWVKR